MDHLFWIAHPSSPSQLGISHHLVCDRWGTINVPQIGSSNFLHRKDKFGLNKKVIDSWKSILTKSELYICSKLTKSEQIALGYKPVKVNFNLLVVYNVIIYPFHLLGVILINPKVFFRTIKKYLKIWT